VRNWKNKVYIDAIVEYFHRFRKAKEILDEKGEEYHKMIKYFKE